MPEARTGPVVVIGDALIEGIGDGWGVHDLPASSGVRLGAFVRDLDRVVAVAPLGGWATSTRRSRTASTSTPPLQLP